MSPGRRGFLSAMLLAATLAAPLGATAESTGAVDPHAHHHPAAAASARSTASYEIPDVSLTRADGARVQLVPEMNDGRPVVLAFIFTTCTTVCPVTSLTLSALQRRLGSARARPHLMSISIDPEQDTPQRLRAYAERFHAGADWQHYTGTVAASASVQRAFDVYQGDKMNHAPAILVRPASGNDWVRFDGFPTAEELLAELQRAGGGR